jgi:hypothetical protein
MLLLLFCCLHFAETALTRFIYWGTHGAYQSGVPSFPVTIVPNSVFCNTHATAVFALHTVFEGKPHTFGITACDDNRIFIGLRITENVLTYMEFESFDDFLFLMLCVFRVISPLICFFLTIKNTMLHLTVTNKSHPGLDALLISSKRFSIKSRVLGMGSSIPIGHQTGGFGLKLKLLKQELELLPPDQLVLFTDAYDVIVQHSLDSLESWLHANTGKVLFAAERSKWPLDMEDLFYPSPLQFPYPYLNSGLFAGTASSILSLLQVPFTNTTDDQGYYSRQFLTGTSCIVLDHRAEYFQCMEGLQKNQLILNSGSIEINHSSGSEKWTTSAPLLHLNNGATRAKYFSTVIHTVLGPQYSYISRQILVHLVTDFCKTNWKLILILLLGVIVLLFTLIKGVKVLSLQ